jgi:hypothetical protein
MWVADRQAFNAGAFPPESADQLPMNGRAGDLLMTIRTLRPDTTQFAANAEASLWLCVTTGDNHIPALWKEVLLGQAIPGRKPRI